MPTASASNGTTWRVWVSSSAATTTASDDNWSYWVGLDTSSTTTADSTWVAWTSAAGTVVRVTQQPQPTEEERAALREQRRVEAERRNAEEERREKAAAEADVRAEELLRSLLTPEQIDNLEKQSAIIVKSEMGKQYRIKRGWSGNVEELDDSGKPIASYCAHPGEVVPRADNMVAQLLMLKTQEAEFLRTANRTALRH